MHAQRFYHGVTVLVTLLALAISARPVTPTDQPVSWFSTTGETIYHLKAARTEVDVDRSIVAASF